VHGQQFIRRTCENQGCFIQSLMFGSSATLKTLFFAGVIDQDAAHRLAGSGKKVGAILPTLLIASPEAQPGFMDQGSWLERVTPRLHRHFRAGQFSQFLVDKREQLSLRLRVTFFNGDQDASDVVHAKNFIGLSCSTNLPKNFLHLT
jgi:hypothetical protein